MLNCFELISDILDNSIIYKTDALTQIFVNIHSYPMIRANFV